MIVKENELLARHTTFHLGGPARFFIECVSIEDVVEAVSFAQVRSCSFNPLGGGSNVLVPDEGVDGVVAHLSIPGISFEETSTDIRIRVGAGVLWSAVVREVCERGLWGIENLAHIPGTLGGAVVQNIGAYGTELADVFHEAVVLNTATLTRERVSLESALFGYRTSVFKTSPSYVVVEATLRLRKNGAPLYRYPDLRAFGEHNPAATPTEVAAEVTRIRSQKFPSLKNEGTAGSFFKNPVLDAAEAAALAQQFPGLPHHQHAEGTIKISLAWILDHVLGLRGYEKDGVRLFENQPLVFVAARGSSAAAVDALADEVSKKVFDATRIVIEREVETFENKIL